MSVEENYLKKNMVVQKKICDEIENVKSGSSNKNIVQLENIKHELERTKNSKNVAISYPRIIIDSWDYKDELGLELLELAELYKRLK